MKKNYLFSIYVSLMLLLSVVSVNAIGATLGDLHSAVDELIGPADYIYFDHEGSDGELGFRTKDWGTKGNLADSSKATWTDNQEFEETLAGLNPLISYDVYVVSGGKVGSTWGVRVGFESGSYVLETNTLADDSSVMQYNLGLYYNEETGSYPFREEQDYVDRACMYAVYVGTVVTDSSGSVKVFVNDGEFTLNGVTGDRTWYDGLLVIPTLKPYNPTPENGVAGLTAQETVLSWMPGNDPNGVISEDFYVYMGSSLDNMVCLNSAEPAASSIYNIGMTEYNTTYYWQVEEAVYSNSGVLYPVGDPNNIFGPVWSFSTVYYVPRMIDITEGEHYREGLTVDVTATYESTMASVNSVTWYLNDVAIDPDTNPNYSVSFTDTESILSVVISDETFGSYSCIATNNYGSSQSSEYSVIDAWPLWTWTGDAGTTLWSEAGNWDAQIAPTASDDVLIGGDAIVDIDLSGNFYHSSYITLQDNAQLICPEGSRFGGGSGASTVTTIEDNSKLLVGPTMYAILSKNTSSTINQTGGEYYAQISRGFLFTDTSGISGTYNLTGGSLKVDYVVDETTTGTADFWSMLMGRDASSESDLFYINGGDAVFTNNSYAGRRIYIMRDSDFVVDSGSASFTGFEKVSVGHDSSGTAEVILNDGELNFTDTPVCVGDLAIGRLAINGGVFNAAKTEGTGSGLLCGYADSGYGSVEQTGGVTDLNGLELKIGSSSSIGAGGEYGISGGSLTNVGSLKLYVNADFIISGSDAESIDIQELSVEDDSAKISLNLDQNGTSLITVGADADSEYNGGAKLDNLTIVVNTLDGYQGQEGDSFDIIWIANNDISGLDSVTLVSEMEQDFELNVVDAASHGYAGGKLIQLSVAFNPARADFNLDGSVDLADFGMFARAWLWQEETEE